MKDYILKGDGITYIIGQCEISENVITCRQIDSVDNITTGILVVMFITAIFLSGYATGKLKH